VTGNDVNAILVRLAGMEATMVEKFNNLTSDNTRGEEIHKDHEERIRALEKVRWLVVGFALAVGGTGGALASRILGG
jgi:hypothetical protein